MIRIKKNVNAVTFWTGKQGFLNIRNKIFKIVKFVIVGFFLLSVSFTIIYRYLPVYITPLMVIRWCENIGEPNAPDVKKKWVPIEHVSSQVINAVVASEDNLFLKHNGFDFDAIEKARKMNEKGKKIYGASTISQQTAKNVFLWPSRSWIRKGFECYFTVLIEFFWSKERIMEVYLNVAEMGNGIYGIESAAQHYYKKSADKLNGSQAAMIVACLPAPRKYNPSNPTSYLVKRQGKIMRLMKLIGPVKLEQNKP